MAYSLWDWSLIWALLEQRPIWLRYGQAGLARQRRTLPQPTHLAGIVTKRFSNGMFGLNPRPAKFSNFSDPSPSYMLNLKEKQLILSPSWRYSAGNKYPLNKVLILGGYDSSMFDKTMYVLRSTRLMVET